MTFRTRVTLLAAGAVAAAIVLLSAVAWVIVRGELRGEVDRALRTQADRVQTLAQAAPDEVLPQPIPPPPGAALGGARGFVQIVSPSGDVIRPPGSEVERLLCDNTRAREWCDWEPQVSLEEGLQRTSDWVRDNLARLETKGYQI